MPNSSGRFALIAVFSATAYAALACAKSDDAAARQVELQPPPTPAVQPPINDAPGGATTKAAPPKQAPAAPAKAPTSTVAPKSGTTAPPAASTPPVAGPKFGVIAAGTEIAVRPAAKVCTNTQKAGDHVSATVAESVTGSGGAVIPAGAAATLEVVSAQYGQNDASKVKLTLRVVSFAFGGQTYDVTGADVVAPPVTTVRRQTTGAQAEKVAAGAVVGAVVGKVIGKSAGATVAGGAVGAATGAVVAKKTADYDGCVAADARLVAKLTNDVQVRAS